MILQALYELAERERLIEDPDFESKDIRWIISLGKDGKFFGVVDTFDKDKAPPQYLIPKRLPSRSGQKPPPELLVDNLLYSLGASKADPTVQDEQSIQRQEAYLVYWRACLDATGDEGAKAVIEYLESLRSGVQSLPQLEKATSSDRVGFRLATDDELISQRPKVVDWIRKRTWQELRPSKNSGKLVQCLVTGKKAEPAPKHPKLRGVPGRILTLLQVLVA